MNKLGKLKRTRSAPAANLAAWMAVFFSASLAFLHADELPGPLTLNIPVAMNLATPAWLGHPVIPNDTLQSVALPITPPNAHAALLMTVYFTESDDGFLRINWTPNGGGAPVALASNFYEGVGMATSRSLLIPPSTLGTGGTLMLQGTAVALGVQRVEFEWLESRQDLVSQKAGAMLMTTADGTTIPAESANGQPAAAPTGTWEGDIVTVPITTDPQRIETGVEFPVDLDKVPTTARLVLKETGLPLTQHLVVWINQARAGTITPVVPGLGDAGFFTTTASSTSYVGWRNGSFYVPVSFLRQGENTLQISAEQEVPGANGVLLAADDAALAVKDVAFQLNYDASLASKTIELPVLHLSAEPALNSTSQASTAAGP